MLNVLNEKLKAMFDWIKSPKSTFFLLLATFIIFSFSQKLSPYNNFYLFVILFGNLFGISLFINLIYISLSEFLLFSILSFVLLALSAVFIGGSHFEDLNIAILALSIPIFLSKLIYTLTTRSTSSKNLKSTNTNIQKNVTKRRALILIAFANLLSLIPAYAATQEISHGWAIRVIIYTLVTCSIIYALNKRKKLSFFSKIFSYPFWLLILEGNVLDPFKSGYDEIIYSFLSWGGVLFFALLSIFNIYTYYKAEDK